MYDYSPKLDLDMINTKKNLGDSEKILKHKWVIEDLATEADLRMNLQAEVDAEA